MKLVVQSKVRWLDFDIENRPLSYWMPDRPTAEITAIAAAFVGEKDSMRVFLLGRETLPEVLAGFVDMYDQAGAVTGHYIRKHDLPIINGALMELGMAPLQQKLTQDTKLDMVRKADIPATQEFLSEMLGVRAPKVQMTQAKWREANRLTPEGLALTEKRVAGDVRQHMKLRKAMLKAGLLKSPRVWRP